MNKNILIYVIIWIWILISVVYIWWDVYSNFKTDIIENSYIAGQNDTINTLIQQGQTCQIIEVAIDDKIVNLINVDCIQTENNQTDSAENEMWR